MFLPVADPLIMTSEGYSVVTDGFAVGITLLRCLTSRCALSRARVRPARLLPGSLHRTNSAFFPLMNMT